MEKVHISRILVPVVVMEEVKVRKVRAGRKKATNIAEISALKTPVAVVVVISAEARPLGTTSVEAEVRATRAALWKSIAS